MIASQIRTVKMNCVICVYAKRFVGYESLERTRGKSVSIFMKIEMPNEELRVQLRDSC